MQDIFNRFIITSDPVFQNIICPFESWRGRNTDGNESHQLQLVAEFNSSTIECGSALELLDSASDSDSDEDISDKESEQEPSQNTVLMEILSEDNEYEDCV